MTDIPDDAITQMILDGIIEVAGVDNNGEFLYSFTDKINELYPNIAKIADELFLVDVNALWEMGYISMDITLENPIVTITEKALDDEAIRRLSPELRSVLELIKSAMLR